MPHSKVLAASELKQKRRRQAKREKADKEAKARKAVAQDAQERAFSGTDEDVGDEHAAKGADEATRAAVGSAAAGGSGGPHDKKRGAVAADTTVRADMLMSLVNLGFEGRVCETALEATKSADGAYSVDTAAAWLLENGGARVAAGTSDSDHSVGDGKTEDVTSASGSDLVGDDNAAWEEVSTKAKKGGKKGGKQTKDNKKKSPPTAASAANGVKAAGKATVKAAAKTSGKATARTAAKAGDRC